MQPVTTREIIHSMGMSPDPNSYLSKVVMSYDFDADRLAEIYQKIKDKIGTKEAEAFVSMVKAQQSLSTIEFLKSLFALEENNWELSIEKTMPKYSRRIYFEEDDSFVYNPSIYIRDSFLNKIGRASDVRRLRFESYTRAIMRTRDFDCDDDDDDDDDWAEYD